MDGVEDVQAVSVRVCDACYDRGIKVYLLLAKTIFLNDRGAHCTKIVGMCHSCSSVSFFFCVCTQAMGLIVHIGQHFFGLLQRSLWVTSRARSIGSEPQKKKRAHLYRSLASCIFLFQDSCPWTVSWGRPAMDAI